MNKRSLFWSVFNKTCHQISGGVQQLYRNNTTGVSGKQKAKSKVNQIQMKFGTSYLTCFHLASIIAQGEKNGTSNHHKHLCSSLLTIFGDTKSLSLFFFMQLLPCVLLLPVTFENKIRRVRKSFLVDTTPPYTQVFSSGRNLALRWHGNGAEVVLEAFSWTIYQCMGILGSGKKCGPI